MLSTPAIYSYVVEHDFGLAPNPFGRYCTLAVCKPKIRKSGNLRIGDWVIGTGSKALEESTGRIFKKKLIYGMEVSERLTFDEYWTDKRFQYKKPMMNGSLLAMFGDNFYHTDKNGKWIQEDSAHSNANGTAHEGHFETDLSGVFVLIAENFYYFGEEAPLIPKSFWKVCHSGIGEKRIEGELCAEFLRWMTSNFRKDRIGTPASWQKYNQLHLDI